MPATIRKIGNYSGKNNTRDFERALRLPVVPCLLCGLLPAFLHWPIPAFRTVLVIFMCKAPDYVETTMKKKEDSEEIVEVKVPVFLPHKILIYLYHTVGLDIPWNKLEAYWKHCKRFCEWAKDFEGQPVPVCLYGDSARYGQGYDQSKITGFWMSLVLWRPKSTRLSQWLLWSLNGDLSRGALSHNPLILAIVRSLNFAFEGVSPEGTQLLHKFAVTEIRGDWEYFWQTFKLKQWYKTRFICWRCRAENHVEAEHSYLDLSENPSWARTMYTNNEFMVHVIPDDDVCYMSALLLGVCAAHACNSV